MNHSWPKFDLIQLIAHTTHPWSQSTSQSGYVFGMCNSLQMETPGIAQHPESIVHAKACVDAVGLLQGLGSSHSIASPGR